MKDEIKILGIPREKESNAPIIEEGYVHSYPIHGHLYHEIIVYPPFDGNITLNGERFDAHEEIAILVTPNDFHSITVRADPDAPYYKMQIHPSMMEGFSDLAFSSSVIQNHADVAFIRSICERAYRFRHDLRYLSACAQAVALTLQKSSGMNSSQSKSIPLIRQATEIIRRHFSEPITLQSVAQELHVSPQHLSALFSRYAQMSFTEYLNEKRLRFAVVSMQNGANVSEACYRSGYRNLSHFIRSFKKKYGVTPAKYQSN